MLRCSALARAGLRPSKYQQQVTRTIDQLASTHISTSISATSSLSRIWKPTFRAYATAVAKKKPAARKPAPKKATTKKTTAKKPATRKKVVAKKKPKKKAVKKPAPKKKKVLSERQKGLIEKKMARDSLAALKVTALAEPKGKPETAWVLFFSEKAKGASGKIVDAVKAAAAEFKNLSPAELEQYNHTANQNKAANQAAYDAFIAKHTPEQIRLANNARRQLKRKTKKRSGYGITPLKDARQVKQPSSGYLIFSTERRNSGDFKNIALPEAAKLITTEWKALGASEKKTYEDLQAADKARYVREYSRTYGHAPGATAAKAKSV